MDRVTEIQRGKIQCYVTSEAKVSSSALLWSIYYIFPLRDEESSGFSISDSKISSAGSALTNSYSVANRDVQPSRYNSPENSI